MTEFEAATVAYQNAALALQQKALKVVIERTAPRQ